MSDTLILHQNKGDYVTNWDLNGPGGPTLDRPSRAQSFGMPKTVDELIYTNSLKE